MLLLTAGLLALLTLTEAGGDHITEEDGTHLISRPIHQEEANLNLSPAEAFSTKTRLPVGSHQIGSKTGAGTQEMISLVNQPSKQPHNIKTTGFSEEIDSAVLSPITAHSIKTGSLRPSTLATKTKQQTSVADGADEDRIEEIGDSYINLGFESSRRSPEGFQSRDQTKRTSTGPLLRPTLGVAQKTSDFAQTRHPSYRQDTSGQEYHEDIKTINRKLIEKQNQEDLKETLSGVIPKDSNPSSASLSDRDVSEISRRLGGGNFAQVTLTRNVKNQEPQTPPANVKQSFSTTQTAGRNRFNDLQIKTVPRSQIFMPPVANPQIVTNTLPVQQLPPLFVPRPQIVPLDPYTRRFEADIIALNRQLVEEQNLQDLNQILSGVVRTDSGIGRVILSPGDVGEISRHLGYRGVSERLPSIDGTRYFPIEPIPTGQSIPLISGARTLNLQPISLPGPQSTIPVRPRISPPFLPQPRITPTHLLDGSRTLGPRRPQFGSDVITTNRQLFEKQKQEDLKHTLSTVVKTDADIGQISLSQRQKTSNIPGPQSQTFREPQSNQKHQTPSPFSPKPVSINAARKTNLNQDIVSINRQLIQRQNQEDLSQTLSGIVGTDSDIGRISLTTGQFQEISRRIGSPVSAPVRHLQQISFLQREPIVFNPIVTPNAFTGDVVSSNIPPAFGHGNLYGFRQSYNFHTGLPISKPMTQIYPPNSRYQPRPYFESNEDIKTLNRNLIAKQADDGFRQTLRGVSKIDSGEVPLSPEEIRGISEIAGYKPGGAHLIDESAAKLNRPLNRNRAIPTRDIPILPKESEGFGLRSGAGNRAQTMDTNRFVAGEQEIISQDRIEFSVLEQENI